MWGSRSNREDETVTCIACGEEVSRDAAREYDKHGDRWDRRDKEFEYLCKPCDRECCHQPRDGLEETLVSAGAGTVSREEFLAAFHDAAEQEHERAD